MRERVFRADDEAAADRLEVWRKRLGRDVSPLEADGGGGAGFRPRTRLLRLGATRVWSTTVQPVTVRRTPELIHQSDPQVYSLTLPLEGGSEVVQAGREVVHGPYDMHLLDSSRPYDLRLFGSRSVHLVGFDVPKALLPLPPERVDRLLVRRLPGREGIGALLSGSLVRLTHDTGSFQPSDGPRVEPALIELLSGLLAHHLDVADSALPGDARRTLSERVLAFVQEHLRDPRLTPSAIAAAHHISVSHLHRVLRKEGITVAAWIRRQRLERARRELGDPALRETSVHRIAIGWGFTHHASFTRAFRAAYGIPPQDYRQRALSS